KREYGTYRAMYEGIVGQLPPPDLLVYLRCSVRTARRRIRERGRAEERDIPYHYVRRIHDLYEAWFAAWDRSPTLVVDSDELDYIHDLAYRADLLQIIARALGRSPTDQVFGC
ncbi:MAG: deoxynucleoside kinase, partial [Deltaproteobacteria bacterium]|nr:deoxynucleoside kinase [Deltaproteobacteria bacterium]